MPSPDVAQLTRIADSLEILVADADQFTSIAEAEFELMEKALQVLASCIHRGPTKAARIHIYMTERT